MIESVKSELYSEAVSQKLLRQIPSSERLDTLHAARKFHVNLSATLRASGYSNTYAQTHIYEHA